MSRIRLRLVTLVALGLVALPDTRGEAEDRKAVTDSVAITDSGTIAATVTVAESGTGTGTGTGTGAGTTGSSCVDPRRWMNRDRDHIELTFGYAGAMQFARDTVCRQFATAELLWGEPLTNFVGEVPYKGSLELLVQLNVLWQIHPAQRQLAGFATLVRYNFWTGTPLVPFVEGGAGVAYHDLGRPEQGGHFAFQLSLGAGVQFFLVEQLALTAEYRYLHISNGYTYDPNWGINLNVGIFGASFFF